MSQHSMTISNDTGAAVRAAINAALQALVGLSGGPTAPATTFAYMLWADTANGLLKMRNAANSGWITMRDLTGGLPGDVTIGVAGTGAANALHLDGAATGQPYIEFLQNAVSRALIQWSHAFSRLAISSGLAVTGDLVIGNTVNAVSPTSPNRTITMEVDGVTLYIHAKTTND